MMDPLLLAEVAYEASCAPEIGLPKLWRALREAEMDGDQAQAQRIRRFLIPVLVEHQVELDRAEELSRELVKLEPTRTHMSYLIRVYEMLGREADAASWRVRAAAAPDPFLDDPDAVAQADEDFRRAEELVDLYARETGNHPERKPSPKLFDFLEWLSRKRSS